MGESPSAQRAAGRMTETPICFEARLPPLHPKKCSRLTMLVSGHGSLFAGEHRDQVSASFAPMYSRAPDACKCQACSRKHRMVHHLSLFRMQVSHCAVSAMNGAACLVLYLLNLLEALVMVAAAPSSGGGLLQWGRPEGNMRRPEVSSGSHSEDIVVSERSWAALHEDPDIAPSSETLVPESKLVSTLALPLRKI